MGSRPLATPPDAGDVRALASLADFETVEETKRLVGIEVPRRHYQPPDHPDVSGLAEGLGL